MIQQFPFMALALEKAREALENDEVPVGAVIVDSKQNILAAMPNKMCAQNDPTAHAEILAIREACKKTSSGYLVDCDLYVTLEPCPMCAQAIAFARIRRLYFGAFDAKGGGVEHGPRIFTQSTCHHRPEVYDGIMEAKAKEMLKAFFAEKRY